MFVGISDLNVRFNSLYDLAGNSVKSFALKLLFMEQDLLSTEVSHELAVKISCG